MKTVAKGISMPIITVNFEVENDIAEGLVCGTYKRHGGVVRWATGPQKGQIVKHLKPVELQQSEEANKPLAQVAELVKANKKLVIVGAVLIAGIAVVGTTCYVINTREPKELKAFRSALKDYLEAAKNQKLSVEVINRLEASVEKLRARKDFEKIQLKLSAPDLAILVNEISQYTARFAAANSVEAEETLKEAAASDDSLFYLVECLNVQKQVLRETA